MEKQPRKDFQVKATSTGPTGSYHAFTPAGCCFALFSQIPEGIKNTLQIRTMCKTGLTQAGATSRQNKLCLCTVSTLPTSKRACSLVPFRFHPIFFSLSPVYVMFEYQPALPHIPRALRTPHHQHSRQVSALMLENHLIPFFSHHTVKFITPNSTWRLLSSLITPPLLLSILQAEIWPFLFTLRALIMYLPMAISAMTDMHAVPSSSKDHFLKTAWTPIYRDQANP